MAVNASMYIVKLLKWVFGSVATCYVHFAKKALHPLAKMEAKELSRQENDTLV